MSSGHASHKGPGVKHSHDSGELDSAATTPANPKDLIPEGEGHPFSDRGSEPNPKALEKNQKPQK